MEANMPRTTPAAHSKKNRVPMPTRPVLVFRSRAATAPAAAPSSALADALRQAFTQRPYALQTQRQFLGELLTDAGFEAVVADLDGLDVDSLASLLAAVLRRPAAPMAEALRNDPAALRVLQVFMRGQRGDD
jgi:hypothetical protein